ncbi:unnamed protein product [Somion occarium]|uniref:Sec39 domain-containing protein n=1 Tax=Somion occarium TaxID=3059160 RepID=A0ABP1CHZ9_9APHY
MASTSSSTQSPYTRWNDINDDQLTLPDVEECLQSAPDDLWVVAACTDRLLDDPTLQQTLLELGLKRTEAAVTRSRHIWEHPPISDEEQNSQAESSTSTDEHRWNAALVARFRDNPSDARLCHLRAVLLDRLDRLNTFKEIVSQLPVEQNDSEEEGDEEWEDDPWADDVTEAPGKASAAKEPLIPLSSFLTYPLLDAACLLASTEYFTAVQVMLKRHGPILWPYRFAILDSIPEHAAASEYRDILPSLDPVAEVEQKPAFELPRPDLDWAEQSDVQQSLTKSQVSFGISRPPLSTVEAQSQAEPLQSDPLLSWYRDRIDLIISSTGMVDVALSLVQHAASQGISGLDEIGEDLSLISRLVYDAPAANDVNQDEWALQMWRSLGPSDVVRAYLAHSTPETVAHDINHLVLPYLYVLEARAERKGHPDPSLPQRMLYEYILQAPLEIIAAIFESSKPTLPPAQRIIRDDEDMVRLALACLYGSDSLNEWPVMSRIFECLPAWETPEDEDETDEVDTTIASLGTFLTPSTTRPRCTPNDIFLFFKPLPSTSLSRMLDVLDVHLESGEILARWSVPAPLRWFLRSNSNIMEQRAWAQRMARRAGGSDDQLSSQEDWEWLLEDMLKLAGSGESGLRGAFCLLSKDDVIRIFFEGLLSSGRFDIAKYMLHPSKSLLHIDPLAVEDICLSCSQEFYDNAGSGNYHFGDMKLAYDCLDVPQQSERVLKEKDFIEATSRLCSFNLMSRPGIPISPIEIRLTKDRLSLVARVLSSNPDAYKHTQVILNLVNKLGFRDDVAAEVKTLAMLADTALQAEDFDSAYEDSQRMVDTVFTLRKTSGIENPAVVEASEVCWVACFQLGRHPDFPDTRKKLSLLGRALDLCPADRITDILNIWRRLEDDDIEERRGRLTARQNGLKRDVNRAAHGRSRTTQSAAASLAERLQHLQIPSAPLVNADAAALANKAFHRVAANFPFSVGARGRSLLPERDRSRSSERSLPKYDGAEVSAQASRVLQKGLGWLLGDEE